jgi:subtilisin family serine protease
MSVAIIDSGIQNNKNLNIVKSMTLYVNDNYEIEERLDSTCLNEHGTIIADIITLINPDVELIDINILDEKLETNGQIMIQALKKALSFKPDIINLSLGTNNIRYVFELRKLIKEAVKNKIIIVAAYSNNNKITFPAMMKNVVGVKRMSTLKLQNTPKSIYFYKNSIFYAPDSANIIYKLRRKSCNYNIRGNSISAAYISGELSLIVNKKYFTQEQVLDMFINIKSK